MDCRLNWATARGTVLTQKLTVSQVQQTLAIYIEPGCTVPCPKEPADKDYLVPDKSTIHNYNKFM